MPHSINSSRIWISGLGIALVLVSVLLLISSISLTGEAAEEDDKKIKEASKVFGQLIDFAVNETKWRKKFRTALSGIPLDGITRDKFAIMLSDMGFGGDDGSKSQEKNRAGLWRKVNAVANIMNAAGSLLSGLSDFINTIIRVGQSAQTTTTTTTTTAQISPDSNIQTTTMSPMARTTDLCPPCCVELKKGPKVVCQRTICPALPMNNSQCADFPICLPPCRLIVNDYVGPSNDADEEDDESYKKRQEKKMSIGVKIFDQVFKKHCLNRKLCDHAIDVFNSLPNNITEKARQRLIDVMVYFKDMPKRSKLNKNQRSTKDSPTSFLVKGLIGNLFRRAAQNKGFMHEAPRRRGRGRTSKIPDILTKLDKQRADKESVLKKVEEERTKQSVEVTKQEKKSQDGKMTVAERDKEVQKAKDERAKLARIEEKIIGIRRDLDNIKKEKDKEYELNLMREKPNQFWAPVCGLCLGKCQTNLKDCEIDCLNNVGCKRGKCVCTE